MLGRQISTPATAMGIILLCVQLLLISTKSHGQTDNRTAYKITTRITSAGSVIDMTTYVKGSRYRVGGEGPFALVITQCDLHRTIMGYPQYKAYVIMPMGNRSNSGLDMANKPVATGSGTSQTKPIVIVTNHITYLDTGERKKILGYSARRVKSRSSTEVSSNDCGADFPVGPNTYRDSYTETDAWYIDLPGVNTCLSEAMSLSPRTLPRCTLETRIDQKGNVPVGYPVFQTMSVHGPGMGNYESKMEVTEISKVALDDSFFDVPAGYRQLDSMSELSGLMTTAMIAQKKSERTVASMTGDNEKKPGTLRIGVAPIQNNSNQSVTLETLRDALAIHFAELEMDTLPLQGSSANELSNEAKKGMCDYILSTVLEAVTREAEAGPHPSSDVGKKSAPMVEVRISFRLVETSTGMTRVQSTVSAHAPASTAIVISTALQKEASFVISNLKQKN